MGLVKISGRTSEEPQPDQVPFGPTSLDDDYAAQRRQSEGFSRTAVRHCHPTPVGMCKAGMAASLAVQMESIPLESIDELAGRE